MQIKSNISLIILIIAMTGFSCNNNNSISNSKEKSPKETYIVHIAFEPDFYNENRIESLELSKSVIKDSSLIAGIFDNYLGYESWEVESGSLTLKAKSIFERIYTKTIEVNSDTNIFFIKKDYPTVFERKEKWQEELKLSEIDTIVIYHYNGNCYTTEEFASVRKISCFKEDTSFKIRYTDLPRGSAEKKSSYKTKNIEHDFITYLNQFYLSAKEKKESKQLFDSTSNAYLFIRINNNIYELEDPSFSVWELYDDLIIKINES